MFFKKTKRNIDENSILLDEKMDQNDLQLTIQNLKSLLSINADVKFREVYVNNDKRLLVHLIYVDGLVNTDYISSYVLRPFLDDSDFDYAKNIKDVIRNIDNGRLLSTSHQKIDNISYATNLLFSGQALLVIDNEKIAYAIDAKLFDKRSISEPTGENVLKGAKEGFIEVLRTNTSICRRKVRSHNLIIEEIVVGKQSLTTVAIVYMNNIANRTIIDEVKKRFLSIDVDRAINSGYIEEFIIDEQSTVFPQILYTERPDKFCESVIDGRVGILIDGLPIAFLAPAVLLQFMQAPEDYSQNYIVSSAISVIRYSSMALTLILPSFYVAITSFHHEMIPTELVTSIASSKEGVPFPMFIEVILMLIAFEVLVEAGLRLPRTIGQAVSIVGALVVGQSAVEAKLLSPATVVVIAITAITSFTMPNQDFSNALRIWRFALVICSSIIGIFGLASGLLILLYHLCRLESFGVPYLSPFVANEGKQLQDTVFRLPLKTHKKRPRDLKTINKWRMKR